MFPCSARHNVHFASQLDPASAILVVVMLAMGSPQEAHAQRCGVDLWMLCVLTVVLTGSLWMCQTGGGLQFPLQHPPAVVALNCLPCFGAVCGKLLVLLNSWTRQVRS